MKSKLLRIFLVFFLTVDSCAIADHWWILENTRIGHKGITSGQPKRENFTPDGQPLENGHPQQDNLFNQHKDDQPVGYSLEGDQTQRQYADTFFSKPPRNMNGELFPEPRNMDGKLIPGARNMNGERIYPIQSSEGNKRSNVNSRQYADTPSGKLTKGSTEGVAKAKQSLKGSFSLTNLAVTTTVAVGTNLAIQMINGQKPSLRAAAKTVATIEFAGGVVGGALGAAGGQIAATLVKTFIPGPIGAMVGAVVPVMFGSAGGIMGSSLAGDMRAGQFSISRAISKVDPVDLIGSAIGSTIGMALGAPIPILGPIIGGIVGGVIGSKVAKWMASGFKIGTFRNPFNNKGISQPARQAGTTFGGEGQSHGLQADGSVPGQGSEISVSANQAVDAQAPVSGDLKAAEQKYYQTYLQYNKLIEGGKIDEAKKLSSDLKLSSDQYYDLKNQPKQGTK